MKIEHRITISNIFNFILIIIIIVTAFQNLNLVLTKLRFIEIADDLNTSFLEMRLDEKNFFLYKDKTALFDIQYKVDETIHSIDTVKNDIVKAVGENNLDQLNLDLQDYVKVINEIQLHSNYDTESATKLREAGRKLREFSNTIRSLERKRVNGIILNSKRILLHSSWIILISALIVGHLISRKILNSMRAIENLALSISEGNFKTIEHIKTKDECGSVIKALNFMSEELKNREEQLIQSKKLASIGVITAGVAHELTNPVNNISMLAQTYIELYDKLSREDRIEFMNKVEGETDRMKEIVKNFLDFSKPKEPLLKEVDINVVVKKAFKLMQNMLYISNIESKLDIDDTLPKIYIDENQILQVIVNLITNAVQAMQKNGKIFIESKLSKDKKYIEISIADTGKGIQPELLPHIFDPFFSTKGEGGTGLGLSVSHGIIKSHKGNITVDSKVGAGTIFTIALPIYNKEKEEENG
ncbi:MAG: ATP-binding protein [Desulfobacteraceae bacterium]|nr:ATP-binding protein [Desulfobacteraceae bacterium]